MKRSIEDLAARTRFEPAEVEPRLITEWLQSGLFHPEPLGSADENYSIAIPPPNVTGALHMGHAFGGTIQDALVRQARLRGQRTKWIFGTDHAGIATQTQVERQLIREGTTREALGREAFVERTWLWREQYGSTIVEQYKRLGASCDYEDERFTLDPAYADAVLRVFVALYERGFIHRDNYLVNWDPGSGSAISDLEVEEREVDRHPLQHRLPARRRERASSSSPRCARRRCSPTSPSPCTRTMSATRRSSGAR